MTDDPKPVDPFIAALEQELDAHHVSLPSDMDPDMMMLCGLARSLLNREREIVDIVAWTDAKIASLRGEIENIKGFKLPEAMRCVGRLTKGKSKSVKVPGMQFGTKKADATIEWAPEDKAKLAEWAGENCPDALTTHHPAPQTTIKKTSLVAYYDRTGRVPRGCHYIEGGDRPYAKPWKPKKKKDKKEGDGNE